MCTNGTPETDEWVSELWGDFNFKEELENLNSINRKNLDHFKKNHEMMKSLPLITKTSSNRINPALKTIKDIGIHIKEKQNFFNNEIKGEVNKYNTLLKEETELRRSIAHLRKKNIQSQPLNSSVHVPNPNVLKKALKFATSQYFQITSLNLSLETGLEGGTLYVTAFLDPSKEFPIKISFNEGYREVVAIDTSSILTKSQEDVLIEKFGFDMLRILVTLKKYLEEKRILMSC